MSDEYTGSPEIRYSKLHNLDMTLDFNVESNYLGNSACRVWCSVSIVDHDRDRESFGVYPVFPYEGPINTAASATTIQ